MLLDTPSLYFRAYFGVPESVTGPDGTPVNAVRGLLDFIARLVTLRSPTHLVACMDADWRPRFRVAAIPAYKAHRLSAAGPDGAEAVPATLARQLPIIEAVLDALGIATLGVPGYEADDVIGTLATSGATSGGPAGATTARMPVDVVTGDRDLLQLVDDAGGVRVLYTAKGVSNHQIVDEAAVTARYGIPGRAYADFALLRGDPSDGLPGVPGIGEKTAAALISAYGDLTGVLAALDDPGSGLNRSVRRKLEAARAYLDVAPVVVRVATDVPVPPYDDALPRVPRDPAATRALADRWGLHSSINRVLTAFAVKIV